MRYKLKSKTTRLRSSLCCSTREALISLSLLLDQASSDVTVEARIVGIVEVKRKEAIRAEDRAADVIQWTKTVTFVVLAVTVASLLPFLFDLLRSS